VLKTWTVVLEIKDDGLSDAGPMHYFNAEEIGEMAVRWSETPAGLSIRCMEVTEAPYGPQNPPKKAA
jgi:hypothetical protein